MNMVFSNKKNRKTPSRSPPFSPPELKLKGLWPGFWSVVGKEAYSNTPVAVVPANFLHAGCHEKRFYPDDRKQIHDGRKILFP